MVDKLVNTDEFTRMGLVLQQVTEREELGRGTSRGTYGRSYAVSYNLCSQRDSIEGLLEPRR